jgi:hypothetical protein
MTLNGITKILLMAGLQCLWNSPVNSQENKMIIKNDTVRGIIIKQSVIQFKSDTAFLKKQNRDVMKLDSLIYKKKKLKK